MSTPPRAVRSTLNPHCLRRKYYYPPTAYNQSKLAQVMFTRQLQSLIDGDEDCHVQVHAVHPGLVDTDLFVHSSTTYIPWIKRILFKVGSAARTLKKLSRAYCVSFRFPKNTEEGSRTIVYAAIAPRLEGKGGSYISNCIRGYIAAQAKSKTKCERLFKYTCDLLKIEQFGKDEQ